MAPLLQSRAVGVTASAAKDAAVPVAMRAGSPVRAGAWPEDADDLVTVWHTHELHQLLYAFEGVAEVETAGSQHLLPPRQAAWIPAGSPTRRHFGRCAPSRCSSSRRWSTTAVTGCGCS